MPQVGTRFRVIQLGGKLWAEIPFNCCLSGHVYPEQLVCAARGAGRSVCVIGALHGYWRVPAGATLESTR